MSAVLEIAKKYLRYVKVSGSDNIYGPCPFHKSGAERHPSFYMNMKTGLWYCHACHKRGTLVQFLRAQRIDPGLLDSILSGIQLEEPKDRFARHEPGKGEHVLNESLLGVFDFCPVDLLKEGFEKSVLKSLDIGFDKKQMRITFPIRDVYGNLVGISGRTVIGEWPRYKVYKAEDLLQYAPDDPEIRARYAKYEIRSHDFLWNMHNVYPSIFYGEQDKVVIVEGYKACIWLVQNGWPYTVALQGSRMSRAQELTLSRLGAEIFLFLDRDQAGFEGTLDTGARLVERGKKIRVCIYPDSYEDEKVQPDNLNREVIQSMLDAAKDFRIWRKDNELRSPKSAVRTVDRWSEDQN